MSSENVNTSMTLFENSEFGSVRVIVRNGEPWFVAKDVCTCLAVDTSNLSKLLDEDEKGSYSIRTPGGLQDMSVVNEPGLYSLILRSRKPDAKKFKRWVTHEVLPSIRKTGSYSMQPTLPDFTNPATAARAWADEFDAKVKALAEVECQKAIIDDQAQTIEAQEIALGDNTNWKAVLGIPWLNTYFINKSVKVTSHIGKVLTAMSRAMGIEKRKAEDDRWGLVGVYHIDVIEEFRRRLDNDPYMLNDIRRHN